MRKIKSYKLFESSDNSDYLYLKDILQSVIFDELDIYPIERDVDKFEDLEYTEHIFWAYRSNPQFKLSINPPSDIESIIIYNMSDKEKGVIEDKLLGLVSLIDESLNKTLHWIMEDLEEHEYSGFPVYDCIIKLK